MSRQALWLRQREQEEGTVVDQSLYVAESKIKEAGTRKPDMSYKLSLKSYLFGNWAIEQFSEEVSRFRFSPFSFNIVHSRTTCKVTSIMNPFLSILHLNKCSLVLALKALPSMHRGGVSHRRPQHPPSMHRGGVSHRRPQTDCCLCEESTLHPVRTLGGGAGTPTQMHTASHRGGLKTRHFLHVRLQGCSFHDHGGPPTRTHTSDAPLRGPAGSPWGPSHQDHKLPTLPPRRRAHGELCGCVPHHKCRGKSWK